MNENLSKNLKTIFQDKYIVPLYQRGFAWKNLQITQLLQDVYESFTTNPEGNYYIGSLIVLKRHNGDFEVIDGQQRLTVLTLITKILGINREPKLYYDARKEIEEFFKEFYSTNNSFDNLQSNKLEPSTYNLITAVDCIKTTVLDAQQPDSSLTITNLPNFQEFSNYFAEKVILVRVELPEETDVASYFEIMNNRGEQLKKHEIIKSLMMAKINRTEARKEFADIWDYCAQINTPIQKCFSSEKRKELFGDNYDLLNLNIIKDDNKRKANIPEGYSVQEILSSERLTGTGFSNIPNNNDSDETDETEFKSIIDFPNFLMHVFKLYYDDIFKSKSDGKEINLNEKYISTVYEKLQNDIVPINFARQLLRTKVLFDRYIVKTVEDEESEDSEKWVLRKPSMYYYAPKRTSTLRFDHNTFNENNDLKSSKYQERIVKALSMLQVTYRTRIYKNWLQTTLKWLDINASDNSIRINADDYLCFLNSLICSYFDNNSEFDLIENRVYSKGVNTPHFLFNFIDYLYWTEFLNSNPHNFSTKKLHASELDFDYKYWNSIEHHLSQEKAQKKNIEYIKDNLGNLCLISKSANSSLSNRDVKEKVQTYSKGNLGPNRRIIYKLTKENNYNWEENEIKNHYAELQRLLAKRYEILNIKKEYIDDFDNFF